MEIAESRPTLTAEAVLGLLQGGMGRAAEMGKAVYVAVMDSTGRLVGLVGSEKAPPICAAVAQQKAYTAVSMRMATEAFVKMLEAVPHERDIFLGQGYIAAAGGLPVTVDGQVAGAVAVSGAGQAEDAECARAALAAIGL